MWRRPPRQIEEILRAWVAVVILLVGFTAMRILLYGLTDLASRIVSLASIVPQIAVIGLSVGGPFLRLGQFYARSLADRLPPGPKQVITLSITTKKGKGIGSDTGVLSLLDGCLRFEGLATAFSIPRARLRRKPGRPFTLLVRLNQQRFELALSEVEKIDGVDGPWSLENSLEQFWRSPSGGEFQSPPVVPHPKPWTSRFFPGRQLVAFWMVVNAAMIVQAEILHAQNRFEAQRVVGLTYFATLLLALLGGTYQLIRTYRCARRELPEVPVFPSLRVTPTTGEEAEVGHVHA